MSDPVDLLVRGAELVVTMNAERREIAGGWIACRDGFVTAVGAADEPPPRAERVLRADGCLVTPGLINTHHHIYQNLTRAYRPAAAASLFDAAHHTVVAGRALVEDGELRAPGIEDILRRHRAAAVRMQEGA